MLEQLASKSGEQQEKIVKYERQLLIKRNLSGGSSSLEINRDQPKQTWKLVAYGTNFEERIPVRFKVDEKAIAIIENLQRHEIWL
uniref:Uncharacterized protein n=1 Tax=Megaselia scalaris TaxID=36166 RepID=T1GXW3_MEGSC